MNYSGLKVTFSYPNVTYSYPKVTYSDAKVTHSDPTVNISVRTVHYRLWTELATVEAAKLVLVSVSVSAVPGLARTPTSSTSSPVL